MRVLQLTAIPLTAERFVLPLARALRGAGFDVELATGPGTRMGELEAAGFPVHRLPISRGALSWRNLHGLGALRVLIRGGRYDVLHTHTPAASGLGRLAARRAGVRLLYTLHGSLWEAGVPGWRRALFTGLERVLAAGTERVFAVNPDDARDCTLRAGIPADRVVMLPAGGAGVGPEFFAAGADPDLGPQVRGRLGLRARHKVVGYVGRTAGAKGMADLVAAFRRMAEREARCRLLIVGDAVPGDRDRWTRDRFLRALGPAADRLLWAGFQAEAAPFMAAMDLLVLPSHREGFGLAVAEAAAVGRPAVATATRGARAVIRPGVTGLLVPVGDPAALAEAALALLADPGARAMGEAARARAAERFTRGAVLDVYLESYERIRRDAAGAGA